MKAAGGFLLLALVLGASASGADDPPTEPEDLIARDVERTYFFHRIRDHCLLGRRPWEFFLRIHYRSTHLADATVDREWNDRGPLRALQRWGIGALSGPVWFAWLTLASAVLLGLARTWRRMGAARRARWIVPALLGAGLVAWGAYPA
ncbi:MAG: hypothetical protein HY608_06135, partial [Planctomycetes bacterium]|nr:hypothetical protein [Planctomycetota bacterium]